MIILCIWKNVNKSFDWPKSLSMWEGEFFTLLTDFSDNCLNSILIQIFFLWLKLEMASNTKLFSVLCTEKIGTKKKKKHFPKIQKYLSVGNLSKKNNLPTDRPTSFFNGRVTANKQFLKDSPTVKSFCMIF